MRLSSMAPTSSSHASLHCAAVLLLLFSPLASYARRTTPLTAFDRAEQMREGLENRPPQRRTASDYERVLDAYRAIYHGEPASPHADAAVNAVADLLAEEGRVLRDRKLLLDAVGQYTYLCHRYPASHFRQSALLRQAEIEESDLGDDAQADKLFSDFLQQYPRSPLAGEARQQLKAMRRNVAREPAAVGDADRTAKAAENAREHARELAELNSVGATGGSSRTKSTQKHTAAKQNNTTALNRTAAPPEAASLQPVAENPAFVTSNGKAAYITGIRHWSTPIYTRVAIDLSDQVAYAAARVPTPDRIYFDLHGARLAPALVGKSVDVTDDGYLRRVRAAPYTNDSTRIVLDVSHVSEYSAFLLPNPWRLIIDIHSSVANGAALYGAATETAANGANSTAVPAAPKTGANTNQTPSSSIQEVASLGQQPTRVKATHHPTTAPIAASVSGTTRAAQPNELEDLTPGAPAHPPIAAANGNAPSARRPRRQTANAGETQSATTTPNSPTPAAGVHEAMPTATGERSLVRALGLKIGRIVIDAGHGGHDSGTVGPGGIEEKDVVLDVALRLGRLLKQRLGADVIYTRDDDTFVPLETRTAIANKAQADLFISVHANSSSDASARGVEVYYLNFTTSPEALEVAARENAVSDQSIYQLSDLVKKITLKDKIDESHEFASDVEASLYSGLEGGNAGLKDRGVKKAPFVVLIGANMPSILAEISFLTNPDDARQLNDPAYRERIAESLYRGVSRYVSGLSGVRVAQNGHPADQ
jgi:N-acetylmuramoyl-L-alanine amidase